MNIDGIPTRTLRAQPAQNAIDIIDQTRLPHALHWARVSTLEEAAHERAGELPGGDAVREHRAPLVDPAREPAHARIFAAREELREQQVRHRVEEHEHGLARRAARDAAVDERRADAPGLGRAASGRGVRGE